MGQPVTVIQKATPKPEVWLFQTNRSLTGMAGERYTAGTDVVGDRPPDELARRLFERGGVRSVHVAVNVATVELEPGASPDGIAEVVEDLYTHYREGVVPEQPVAAAADGA
jgi:hypothetical protein